MPAISHDLRPPTITIVGKFNPAIFSNYWIATHLFGVADGEQITVTETTSELPGGLQLTLTFVEGVGIHISNDRVQVSLIDFQEGTINRAVSVLRNLVEKLPHTPIGAIGVNFRWFDVDAEQPTLDLFDTPENLEGKFEILDRTSKFKISGDDFELNLSRHLVDGEVVFEFNYHREVDQALDLLELVVDGFIKADFAHSRILLEDVYEYDEFGSFTFKDGAVNVEGGEGQEAVAAENAEDA